MNTFNIIAYRRMPTQTALPDYFGDMFRAFGLYRGMSFYMDHQPADILSITLTTGSILCCLVAWDKVNVRKLAVSYNLAIHLRTLLFSVTGLSPPCIGYPRCPCAHIPYAKAAGVKPAPVIAFKYTFSFGLQGLLGPMPQCGDLTMSGHTIYLWVCGLFIMDTMSNLVSGWLLISIKFCIYTLLFIVSFTIILIRNHYSIDVVIAIVFTCFLWHFYALLQSLLLAIKCSEVSKDSQLHKIDQMYIMRIMKILERDIDTEDEPDDSSDINSV